MSPGDRCWIVDVVAPLGGAGELLETLKESVLADKKVHVFRHASQSRERKAGAASLQDEAVPSTAAV